MRILRWTQRVLVGVFALLLVVIAGVTIASHTRWGQEFLRSKIEAQLDAVFVGGARVGAVEGNPLSVLILRDVVIDGPDHQPAISFSRLRITLPLLPLISHQIRVDKVIVDDLDVAIKPDQLDHFMKPAKKSTWSFALPNVEVHRGHVAIETGATPINIDELEVFASTKLPFGRQSEASVVIRAKWREHAAPISIAAVVRADKQVLAIPTAVVGVGRVELAASEVRIPTGNAKASSGTVAIAAPAAEIAAMVPGVRLPVDLALAIQATPGLGATDLAITGGLGVGTLRGFAHVDLLARTATGFVAGAGLDLGQLSTGRLDGTGGALAAFDVATRPDPTGKAIIAAWGDVGTVPHTSALIAVDVMRDRLRATIGAGNAAGLHAGIDAEVHRAAGVVTLDRAVVVATTRDPARATGGTAPIHGVLSANLTAHGELSPSPDLAIAGTVDGQQLRVADFAAQSLALRINARHLPAHPAGTARVEFVDLMRGEVALGKLVVAAGDRPDGKLQVSLRSQPKQAPWLIDADMLVTLGSTVLVDIQRDVVRASGGEIWQGQSGHLVIGPRQIELRDLRSTSANGRIAAAGTYVHAGEDEGDLTARLDGALDLVSLGGAYHGRVDAKLDVERHGGRWGGTVVAKTSGVATKRRPDLALDADAKVELRGRKLTAAVSASANRVGSVQVALDVDTPLDAANVAAWRKLDADAIRTARVVVHGLDLHAVADLAGLAPMQGTVDGDLELAPETAKGTLKLRGVRVAQLRELGDLDADVGVVKTSRDDVTKLTVAASIPKVGEARLEASVENPHRIFDPAAWHALGGNAMRGAKLHVGPVAFEPGMLERFGVTAELTGRITVDAELAPGLRGTTFAVDVEDLRGGVLAQRVAVHLDGASDEHSTHGALAVYSTKGITLVAAELKLPLSVEQLRADPAAAKLAPIVASVTIPNVPAKSLLPVFGTVQVTGGTFDGKVDIAGTLTKPTANGTLVAYNVTVPNEGTKPTQAVKQLAIEATWDGEAGTVAIHGDETGGGKLEITAAGRADAREAITTTLAATKVDLAPLAAFMPGPAGGIGGILDAKLTVRGVDPRTADIAGTLAIRDGRLPLAPAIGTLFHGEVRATVENRQLDLKVAGEVGGGTVELAAKAPLDAVSTTGGHATLKLHHVKLIGTTEPVVDATITASIGRVDNQWRAQLVVDHALVKIPDEKGEPLAPVGMPSDVVYRGHVRVHSARPDVGAPDDPALVAEITLHDTRVESKEIRGNVAGKLTISVAKGEVGIVGHLALDSADLDLFGRRYNVDRAAIDFDGSPDPVLDVRISHDFPDVTTITEVRGRMSAPEIQLSSEPGTYSEAELLGFLLGGEPGGDPNGSGAAAGRAGSVGASFVANQIGGYVKKVLPIDIDVLRYESATAMNSSAVTVGTWLTRKLFLAYRQHLETRPDENAGEGEIEYWLQRRLVLEGTVGDRGYDGVDLLWRRRW